MPGRNFFRTKRTSFIQERLEFYFTVAEHVRVGRTSGAIFGQEMLKHAIPVLGREVAGVEGNVEAAADGYGVLAILVGGARAVAIVFLPVLHEEAFHFITGTSP